MCFDEATSALDTQTEKEIQASIEEVSKGSTTLTIAHRLSTLDHCDRIFVFEKGQLVEEGSKSELEAKKGHFYKLHHADECSCHPSPAGLLRIRSQPLAW